MKISSADLTTWEQRINISSSFIIDCIVQSYQVVSTGVPRSTFWAEDELTCRVICAFEYGSMHVVRRPVGCGIVMGDYWPWGGRDAVNGPCLKDTRGRSLAHLPHNGSFIAWGPREIGLISEETHEPIQLPDTHHSGPNTGPNGRAAEEPPCLQLICVSDVYTKYSNCLLCK